MTIKTKSLKSLIDHWNCKIDYANKNISLDKRMRFLSEEETKILLNELRLISHEKASENNIKKWNIGWGQNLNMLNEGYCPEEALTPCYFGKYPGGRIMGNFYYDELSTNFESLIKTIRNPEYQIDQSIRYKSLENKLYRMMIEHLVFNRILKYCKQKNLTKIKIVDLGAGSCHNILHLSRYLKNNSIKAELYATDWSESTKLIIRSLNEKNLINNAKFLPVNYFDEKTFEKITEIKPNILYSIASLEQFPGNPDKLLSKILEAGTNLCIHIEPIKESLSQDKPNDIQSIKYMGERNYLNNIIGAMLTVDMNSNYSLSTSIFRTGLGSIFLDGYTQVSYERND